MPNKVYKGQNPTRLVKIKTTSKINNTIPNVPVIVPVKYNIANAIAATILMIRSADPIFFFIKFILNKLDKNPNPFFIRKAKNRVYYFL
jgi:hypothetical protein